ncbi:MAG: class I SAM-dependent methyltransferase [Allosphingosinicella sp.]|uniref:class I SAM-dependent methyltransferase n=1 Tax=Allosphingosinicella sp. TaxID=2823234 RepID=UPI00392BAD5F
MLGSSQLLGQEAERTHYLNHENDPDDPGYRRFVSKMIEPLAARLSAGALGLDYGCGSGPVGAAMLREQGFSVALYDPFFAPDEGVLGERYDFIICSEVIEHFHRPADEFDRLAALLKPGAWLGLMTCFQTDDDRFADWHYRLDPTHVVFYREATLRRLASIHGWDCEIPAKDVALMRVPATP